MADTVREFPIVNSHNEWDTLEEVIVGVLDGATALNWEIGFEAVTATQHLERSRKYHLQNAGEKIPSIQHALAQKELDYFVHVLEQEGVKVVRPDPLDHSIQYGTPDWSVPGGNCQANPRDVLIVFGDEIIEAPMAWRSRYFEFLAYRKLVKNYFRQGARWTAAPKPAMSNRSYNYDWKRGEEYVTTEYEPMWDAADMARCGKDIFIQRSHVTNDFAIDWLQRHLGDDYRLHRVEFDDYRAIHIDATFVPLAPGKLMMNPDRPIKSLPTVIKNSGWDILTPPRSTLQESHPWYWSFRWLSMNMLNIDQKRVIVEASEEPMIKQLKDWGFDPIPVPFRNNYKYGGSFHCATVDIRRRSTLEAYF